MSCQCKHEESGFCTRYPKTNTTVMGRLVWAYPPADHHCGERAPRTGAKAKTAPVEGKDANPAPDGARAASKAKKAKAKAD